MYTFKLEFEEDDKDYPRIVKFPIIPNRGDFVSLEYSGLNTDTPEDKKVYKWRTLFIVTSIIHANEQKYRGAIYSPTLFLRHDSTDMA